MRRKHTTVFEFKKTCKIQSGKLLPFIIAPKTHELLRSQSNKTCTESVYLKLQNTAERLQT